MSILSPFLTQLEGAGRTFAYGSEEEGIFRVLYVARFEGRIHVLHAFQKKTQKIRKQDRDIAKARYSAIAQEETK
uniref:Phage derived protein Gp49-like (DUF891) n=1 Tax=Candidatus Kentrum sp. DK TaxID=2126562 RepID=A0A450TIW1_9GAMM|nr:MAG: Phage derived protein Gp49-like (DUF891) [Candidatus Kentron sp. DK]